jgi:hypothetical protein
MSQAVSGSFSTGAIASLGQVSDSLLIPYGVANLYFSAFFLDASNTIKTQKRASPSIAWSDVTTYNSNQSPAVAVAVTANEEWRVIQLAQQALRSTRYRLSVESE